MRLAVKVLLVVLFALALSSCQGQRQDVQAAPEPLPRFVTEPSSELQGDLITGCSGIISDPLCHSKYPVEMFEYLEGLLVTRTQKLYESIIPAVKPIEVRFERCGDYDPPLTYRPRGCGGDTYVKYDLEEVVKRRDYYFERVLSQGKGYQFISPGVTYYHAMKTMALVDHEVAHAVRHQLFGWHSCYQRDFKTNKGWLYCVHEGDAVFMCVKRAIDGKAWNKEGEFWERDRTTTFFPEDTPSRNWYGWDGHSKIDVSHCAPALVDN